jgi:NAD(P)-dependent dehydrogenase (short-subunit alcohol dehydrogenase family)
MKETFLITGANRGIGLELTKLCLSKNFNVEACCRYPETSDELNSLTNHNPHLNITKMDVTNSKSILSAAENFQNEIDILVCNAGVNNGKGDIFSKEHNENAIMEVMMVNVGGPFLTIQNLYKNLNKNSMSKIVIISSLMGTQTHLSNNAPIYRASKAAANNLMRTISNHFLNDNIIVSSYHPGWVRTDMGGANADISAEESATGLINHFLKLQKSDTGKFFNYDGKPLPL